MTKQEKDTYLRCLGYAVKIYRLRRGMTQEQLAISSGYVDGVAPRSTMSKVERGKIDLTQSKIKDISEAFQAFEPFSVSCLVAHGNPQKLGLCQIRFYSCLINLRHVHDNNTKKCPRQLRRVNEGKSRGIASSHTRAEAQSFAVYLRDIHLFSLGSILPQPFFCS